MKDIYQWELLYSEEFGETHDFSGVRIPVNGDFTRPIIAANGMTLNRAYDTCAKKFNCWRYVDNLDKNIPTNDRTPTKTYAVCVRDRVEADEELSNLSADDLTKQKIAGITLLERLLLELKYFRETGKHLDIKNVTLCSGSRYAGGNVPNAYWYDCKFEVSWDYRDCRYPFLRSRAVSLL
mgnify:CR=1 FL=1